MPVHELPCPGGITGHVTAKRPTALTAARAFVNDPLSTYCFSLMRPRTTDIGICSHACRCPVPGMIHAVRKCDWPTVVNVSEVCIISMFS